MHHPLPLIDGCLVIDNSGWIETLSTCPRLLQYQQLERRVLANRRSALTFGSALHLALEYRYSKYTNRPLDQQYYEDVTAILSDLYVDQPIEVGDFRSLNWALELTRKYNDRYAVEEFNLLSANSPRACEHCKGRGNTAKHDEKGVFLNPCLWCSGTGHVSTLVELPFSIQLFVYPVSPALAQMWFERGQIAPLDLLHITANGGIRVIYAGKIDLPVLIQGKLFVLDHKTTSMLGESFWNERRMAAQQKGYAWAFEKATGQTVHGYMINALRTKEPPLYVTSGSEFKGKGGKTSTPASWWAETFARERFYLHEGELAEWERNTISLVEEFFFHFERSYFPQKTVWCCAKYGMCQYYNVCSTHPASDRPFVLSSGEYQPNTWSPLNS